MEAQVIGQRPAGQISPHHPLVRLERNVSTKWASMPF